MLKQVKMMIKQHNDSRCKSIVYNIVDAATDLGFDINEHQMTEDEILYTSAVWLNTKMELGRRFPKGAYVKSEDIKLLRELYPSVRILNMSGTIMH